MKKRTLLFALIFCGSLSTAQPFSLSEMISTTTTVWNEIVTLVATWWRGTPTKMQELDASAASREATFAQVYRAQAIPQAIAEIAGYIDRLQDDITALKKELTNPQLSDQDRTIIIQEIGSRDAQGIAFLKKQNDILELYSNKAMKQRDSNLFKFVHVLRTRTFLFE